MRVASFVADGRPRVGLVEGEGIVDLTPRVPEAAEGVRGLLEQGALPAAARLRGLAADFRVDEVTFLPAVPDPRKIFLILLNYETDRLQQGRPKLAFPHLMPRFADSQVGHDQALIIPSATREFDFEGEIAVVIGKGGRRIPRDQALAHVAGYSCYNDCGARDFMRHTRHFTAGKNFPASAGFGPWVATADETPPLPELSLTTRLNGEVYQQARGDDLTFPVDELVAYISSFTTLYPGDVIATGSPGGAGHTRAPPRYLQPGDVVEVEVSGVGVLRNSCVGETEA